MYQKVTRPFAKPEQCHITVAKMQAAKSASGEMKGLPR